MEAGPDLERALGGRVAGIDEAGRGPWAGPVVAAAVILDYARIPPGIDDSKRLTARRRAALFEALIAVAEVGIGRASVEEIDAMNIAQATALAMRRAVAELPAPPDFALVDGRHVPPGLPCRARALVGGDGRSLAVAAASIVAKVTRDRIMAELAREWPGYGWERNAGYGVPEHAAALARLGVSPHHRRSFRPVHKILCQYRPITA
ncbi:MAG: ribonuclease HII [Paracoccaceae bacterium]|nr:MAG: ribonuclease HII [Paracoccaceae bacterium]